jgi:hypothetical protein
MMSDGVPEIARKLRWQSLDPPAAASGPDPELFVASEGGAGCWIDDLAFAG